MDKRLEYLSLSYPNFTLGSVINPDEANQNNYDLTNSINDIVDETKYIIDSLSAQTGATEIGAKVTGLTGVNVQELLTALKQYTDALRQYVDSQDASITNNINAHKSDKNNPHGVTASQLGVYTKTELDPFIRGGDTIIKCEVFTIVNPNLGNGTFTYKDKSNTVRTGTITPEGYQVFTLLEGKYTVGQNRVSVIVGDVLHRSVASGGLLELDQSRIALTSPEGSGTEITITYFEKIGVTGTGFVQTSPVQPTTTSTWFKVIG